MFPVSADQKLPPVLCYAISFFFFSEIFKSRYLNNLNLRLFIASLLKQAFYSSGVFNAPSIYNTGEMSKRNDRRPFWIVFTRSAKSRDYRHIIVFEKSRFKNGFIPG